MLLHPQTLKQVEQFINTPAHALIVMAPVGGGKQYLMRYLAAKLLNTAPDKLDNTPGYKELQPIGNTITVDQIRELRKFVQLKTVGRSSIRRVVAINNAELMNNESQNALLKLLEEPPEDTVIILSAPASGILKPTIYSRARHLYVQPVPEAETVSYFTALGFAEADILKAFRLSHGATGLIQALLTDSSEHVLAAEIIKAKELLSVSVYERLIRVNEISKIKEHIPQLLYALKRVVEATIHQAAQKNDKTTLQRRLQSLKAVHEAERDLAANPNTKLLMTDLLLQL
jgi:DNA polymerase III subunit delta'